MSVLETAIRNALDKSDRADPEVRSRIYQSARTALENGMKKQGITDPLVMAGQRQRLETLIDAIEADEHEALPALDPEPENLEQPQEAASFRDQGELSGVVPGRSNVRGDERNDIPADPVEPAPERLSSERRNRSPRRARTPDSAIPAPEVKPDQTMRRSRRRSSWLTRIFVLSVMLAFGVLVYNWVESSGLLLTLAERDTSVPNPPPKLRETDFNGDMGQTLDPAGSFGENWIDVFTGSDAALLRAGKAATLSALDSADGEGVLIASSAADVNGEIGIPVPASVLQQLAGKPATIALSISTENDAPTELYVLCAFAAMGECGRHRFTTTPGRSDYIFRVTFSGALAPSEDGMLMVNSDVTGKGRALILHGVRILPGS